MTDCYVMIKEPLVFLNPQDVRKWLCLDQTEKNLATAFANVSNKAGWLLHEADSSWEYRDKLHNWMELEIELYNFIFDILSKENENGFSNHKLSGGAHYIAEPFMNRNGYIDGGGWWIKEINA